MSYTLAAAKRDHDKWFQPEAMRFFGTRLHEFIETAEALYLVTSEQPPSGPRTWNVRRFDGENSDTLGPEISTGWGSHTRAVRIAGKLAEAETNGDLTRRDGDFRPCASCMALGKQYPGWATYIVRLPNGDAFDICSDHVPTALTLGNETN